jgi:hypothetical protein
MTTRLLRFWCSAIWLITLCLAGCNREQGPPPSLAVEKIPAELEKAFAKASPESKDLVAKVTSGLQTKDFPAAYDAIQALGAVPSTTKEQRSVATRAMLTIYGLLQEAQSQGDEKSAAALRYHQSTK